MSDDLDEPIEVGDVVVLNSGGPAMSVNATQRGRAVCCWFNSHTEELESADFSMKCLRHEEGILTQDDDDDE